MVIKSEIKGSEKWSRDGRHLCPVCKQHEFLENDSHDHCPICHWEDDDYQYFRPLEFGANRMCIVQAMTMWKKGFRCSDDEYDPTYVSAGDDYKPVDGEQDHLCPVCGEHTFTVYNSNDICPVCGWVDEMMWEIHEHYKDGSGDSLYERREAWNKKKEQN